MDHTSEQWEYVEGFEIYSVSTLGNVLNMKFDRMLIPQRTDRGYMKVMLRRDYQSHQFYVHQLVAAAFMPDYRPGRRVTHADKDRSNNELGNLILMGSPSRPPVHYDSPRLHARRLMIVETGEVFRTAYDCAAYIGGSASSIYRVLNGYRNSHMGYTFKYVESGMEI